MDLSAGFITVMWRNYDATNDATNDATDNPNVATNLGTNIGTPSNNIGTSSPNDATSHIVSTDHLAENKRIIDDLVKPKVKLRMTNMQIRELIIEACIVEHSVEELAQLLHKSVTHIRNCFITDIVADGILLPTKPRHSPGQTYITNPKLDK